MIGFTLLEILALAPLVSVAIFAIWKGKQLDRQSRRDPITTDLRNLPGASLQELLEKFTESRADKLILLLSVGMLIALFIAARRMDLESHPLDWIDGLFVLAAVIISAWSAFKIAKDMPLQRKLRRGIRAEQATAQEIASSLAGDNRVIHDIQAKGFNIDHVVITPAGIFAIETKSRQKPPSGGGTDAVRVRYDGKQLEFPGWTEIKPIEQASRQAAWLSNYLRETTGEAFPVTPALALPGWYIELTGKYSEGMVRVFNPKKSSWLFLPERQAAKLDAGAIQRAANAIEKLAQMEGSTAQK